MVSNYREFVFYLRLKTLRSYISSTNKYETAGFEKMLFTHTIISTDLMIPFHLKKA